MLCTNKLNYEALAVMDSVMKALFFFSIKVSASEGSTSSSHKGKQLRFNFQAMGY